MRMISVNGNELCAKNSVTTKKGISVSETNFEGQI